MIRSGFRHPDRRAEVVSRRPLVYADGPDPETERPEHVRAASGLARWGDRLALVQDDALFLALVDPDGGGCACRAFPARHGARTFDVARGNKKIKPDLESVVALGDRLVAFPSGSAPGRDALAVVDADGLRWREAPELYRALAESLPGVELNVEAARVEGAELWLFHRGNGAPPRIDARLRLDRAAFERWLATGAEVPPVRDVERWDLGTIDGVRLTFTDVTGEGPALFSAAAEASPNAIDDGAVAGVAIGLLADGGWAPVTEGGTPIRDKIEGLAWFGERLFAVTDPDDPALPGALLEIARSGRWE